MTRRPMLLNWSGGKDAAMALLRIRRDDAFRIHALLTTVNDERDRISMHGVRTSLLEHQAHQMDLSLDPIRLPEWPSMDEYENQMKVALESYTEDGIRDMAFGDIFLEDLRDYREKRAERVGMHPHFPIWGDSTDILARNFIREGFRAIVVCVNDRFLDKSFAGREYDEALLNDLPDDVDPCGEHGEFHTFVYDAPYFAHPIHVDRGETVHRTYSPSSDDNDSSADTDPDHSGEPSVQETGFWYCDLHTGKTKTV